MIIFGKVVRMPRSKRSKAKGRTCMAKARYLLWVADTYHRSEVGGYSDTGAEINIRAVDLMDRAAQYFGFANSSEMERWHYNQ